MFRSDSKPQMCLGIPQWTVRGEGTILGDKKEKTKQGSSSSSYMTRYSHPVSLVGCNKDQAAQRWLLGDDDRVHSAAYFDWCLTALPHDAQGMFWWARPRYTMSLRRCTSDNDENENDNSSSGRDAVVARRQRFMLVGNGTATFLESFVHSIHSDYENHDIVRLAFWMKDDPVDGNATNADTDTSFQMLEIFKVDQDILQDEGQDGTDEPRNGSPIYTAALSSHSNVIEIAARKLFVSSKNHNKDENDDGPITLVARLGTAQSAEFTIQPYHPVLKTEDPAVGAFDVSKADPSSLDASTTSLSSSSSMSWVTIVGIVVGIVMFTVFVGAILFRQLIVVRKQNDDPKTMAGLPSHVSVDKPTLTAVEEDEEDARTVESHSVIGDNAFL